MSGLYMSSRHTGACAATLNSCLKMCRWGLVILPLLMVLGIRPAASQSVSVGAGSYTTTLPSGAVGPRQFNGNSVSPKVSSGFALPIQTNDYWSSLIFPFFGVPHSNLMYAHPAAYRAVSGGLEVGYNPQSIPVANDFLFPFRHQLTVGVQGMNASRTTTDSYGDWSVTALWSSGARALRATIAQGSPFAYFEITGGNALIQTHAATNIWYRDNGVIGMTVGGVHYGVFAVDSVAWSGTTSLTADVGSSGYLAVALLPDASTQTLAYFRARAYNKLVDTQVTWTYDEATATLKSTFALVTTPVVTGDSTLVSTTLSALYPHQWRHASAINTPYTYHSPRGEMRLWEGTAFDTRITHGGVLPSLPNLGRYNPETLRAFVREAASETLGTGPSYENGKAMGRFANLVHIADQMDMAVERDHFLGQLKNRLEEWLSAGGAQQYMYNAAWDVLTGYPSGYGADDQINDHSFHSGYAIMSAATVAMYDPQWAAPDQWGGMVNLLIKDSNNWDRTDTQFPFLRGHAAYAGHSWAAGHGDFGDGNNQESSSESMHFAAATLLWGAVTEQPEIRDLGIFLHATERTAVEDYWFDVHDETFPADYPHVAIGMVWGTKGVHSTWFGADPEFIHGINLLPITGGSLYLGRHPHHVRANVAEIAKERGSAPVIWKDVIWQYHALADPGQAMADYLADPTYEPFDGESRAHTYHWLGNLHATGAPDTSVTANVPTYAVFQNAAGERSYAAFNPHADSLLVSFSDGFAMKVGPRDIGGVTTSAVDANAPVVIVTADPRVGKAPLRVSFGASQSFVRDGSSLDYVWDFGDGRTGSSADTLVIFDTPGFYMARVTVSSTNGTQTTDSIRVEVRGNGQPYQGQAFAVPGRLEAERFDEGGPGVAYWDTEPQNIGLAFRPQEGVDIETIAGGYAVYWMVDGEWLEYTISVSTAGTYRFTPYLATVPGFGQFRMLVDNVAITPWSPVPSTGGFQFYQPFRAGEVALTEGTHILRFEVASPSDKDGWLYSLNYFQIEQVSTTAREDRALAQEGFQLNAVFPNPAQQVMNVVYTVDDAQRVELVLFDLLNREVRRLLLPQAGVGTHTHRVDVQGLASGVYGVRLLRDGAVRTGRIVIVQ